MKHTRGFFAMLLALVLVLGLGMTAFAEDTDPKGTITIGNAVDGQTYTIYKLLNLESYEGDKYVYTAEDAWVDFLKAQTAYVTVDAGNRNYVTWVDGADPAAFAKLALEYAKEHSIAGTSMQKTADSDLKFENLDLGYYLVDSTLGALCALDTTANEVTIHEKNAVPTNVKQVQEDANQNYGNKNDADLAQTVAFRSTVTITQQAQGQATAGAQKYIFHDTMSAGLTFDGAVTVKLNGAVIDATNYTLNRGDNGAPVTCTKSSAEAPKTCTFEVVFTDEFCESLKGGDILTFEYTATLNSNAVVGGDGNTNTSSLIYGEEHQFETAPSQTRTYTWEAKIFKYALKKEDGVDKKVGLADAEFILYKTEKNGEETVKKYASFDENNHLTGWVDKEDEATKLRTPEGGILTILGLDADTYYLQETKAPKGYNRLKDPVKVAITSAEAEGDATKLVCTIENVNTDGQIEVLNQSGTELPSTGGMGTTLFYVLGSVLAIGAGVLLVTKKRMA